MGMKRTELEKLKGLKINARMKGTPTPARFGKNAGGSAPGQAANPLISRLLGRATGAAASEDEKDSGNKA